MPSLDRWQQVERLYYAALARDKAERTKFLREACGGDETLRREVESLLTFASEAHEFMAAPAIEVVAAALSQQRLTLPAGTQLGPYTIIAPLGAGGMDI